MKTSSKPTRVQLPPDRKSAYPIFCSLTALAAGLALLGGPSSALAQADNFNDGEDTFPVAWTHIDVIDTALGGGSPQNTYDASTFQYHLTALTTPSIATLGPARTMSVPSDVYTDFYVSVDVVAWNNTYIQPFGLLARGSDFGPLTTDGYLLGYANGDALLGPGGSYVTITRVENDLSLVDVHGSGPDGDALMKVDLDPTKDYRFVFMGHGTHLEGRVYELPNLTTPIAVVSGDTAADSTILTSGQCGLVAFNFYSATFEKYGGPVDVTFDNYYASARCPMTITDMVIKDTFDDGNDTAPTVAWIRNDPINEYPPFGGGFPQNHWSFPSANTYRLQADVSPNPALGPGRVASVEPTILTDFRVAVDIVNWDANLDQAIGILARLTQIGLGSTDGYALTYQVGDGDIDIRRVTDEGSSNVPVTGEDSLELVPGNSYRFVFSGKGNELRALVFELPETMNPLVDCLGTDTALPAYSSGKTALLGYDNTSGGVGTADVTFDNYSDMPIAPPPSVTIGSGPSGEFTVTWPGNLECVWVLESSPVLGVGAVWTEVPTTTTAGDAAKILYDPGTGKNTYTTAAPVATSPNTYYRLKQL